MNTATFKISFSPIKKISFHKLGQLSRIVVNTNLFHSFDFNSKEMRHGVLLGQITNRNPNFMTVKLLNGESLEVNLNAIVEFHDVNATKVVIRHENSNFHHREFFIICLSKPKVEIDEVNYIISQNNKGDEYEEYFSSLYIK